MRRKRTGQPPEPAPDVERCAAMCRPAVGLRLGEQHGDRLDAGGEEPVDVPAPVASAGLGEHRPEGIDPTPVLPRGTVLIAAHPEDRRLQGSDGGRGCSRALRACAR